MELAHLPNNTTFLLSKPWKFQFISCSGSKVIPFLLPDRQTHILHPYMHGQDFFLYGNLYLSQHYVSEWALLTHSLRLWRINISYLCIRECVWIQVYEYRSIHMYVNTSVHVYTYKYLSSNVLVLEWLKCVRLTCGLKRPSIHLHHLHTRALHAYDENFVWNIANRCLW